MFVKRRYITNHYLRKNDLTRCKVRQYPDKLGANMMTGCQARLNTEAGGGAWCPSRVIDLDHSLEEWLEVDLGQETLVTAVVVQGRYANGLGQEYAEYYALR